MMNAQSGHEYGVEAQFPESVTARYRVAKALSQAGQENIATDYLDLLRLKEELELFIWDIVSLGRGRQIIYAIDDVCLSAYVEMNRNNCRSFSFPVIEDSSSTQNLKIRGMEYAWRLKRLLLPQLGPQRPAPLLILPSAMPGLMQFAQHLENKNARFEQRIDYLFDQILQEEPTKLKDDLDQLANHLRSQWPFAEQGNRPQRATDSSNYLRDHLYVIYQFLWNHEQTKKFIDIFSQLLQKANLIYLHTGLSPLLDYVQYQCAAVKPTAIKAVGLELESIFLNRSEPYSSDHVETIFQLLLEMDKETAYGQERRPESLWIASTNVGYLSAINQAFEKNGINAVVQLVTHRQKLTDAVRAWSWEKQGVALRHPKFLAADLNISQRHEVVGLANRVIVFLERMIKDVEGIAVENNSEKNRFNKAREAIRAAQKEIESPWNSIKANIYLDDVTFESVRQFQVKKWDVYSQILDRLKKTPEAMKQLSLSSVDFEGEYLLVHQILATWAKGQHVFIARVPPFEDTDASEMEHVMIAPLARKLRYIIKIPVEFFNKEKLKKLFGDESTPGSKFYKHEIMQVVNALHQSDVPLDPVPPNQTFRVRQFSQALCASVNGNWTLVEELLREKSPDESYKEETFKSLNTPYDFWKYERFFLRQFGLRAMAARAMGGRKWVALSYLDEAGKLLQEMAHEKSTDIRYRLARIGWNLEVLVVLVETGETDIFQSASGDAYVTFKKLSSPKELVKECFFLIDTINNRFKDVEKNKKNVAVSQKFYWQYMQSRVYQMLMMVMATTEANLIPNSLDVLYSLKYQRISGYDLYNEVEKGILLWKEILDKLCSLMDGDKIEVEELLKKYPTATFLHNWFKLQKIGCTPPAKRERENSRKELEQARKCMDHVFGIFEILENSCRELSPDGFPRRVFRRLKSIEYQRQRILLKDILHSSLERLEQEAIYSYKEW
ncbi:MAG: hypothetical protein H7832_00935 [Magnetococcus sp. DMHC-6]